MTLSGFFFFFFFSRYWRATDRKPSPTVFTRWVVVFMTSKLSWMCKIGGIPLYAFFHLLSQCHQKSSTCQEILWSMKAPTSPWCAKPAVNQSLPSAGNSSPLQVTCLSVNKYIRYTPVFCYIHIFFSNVSHFLCFLLPFPHHSSVCPSLLPSPLCAYRPIFDFVWPLVDFSLHLLPIITCFQIIITT